MAVIFILYMEENMCHVKLVRVKGKKSRRKYVTNFVFCNPLSCSLPSSQMASEERGARLLIVSDSVHSEASPPTGRPSPGRSHSPVRSVEESGGDMSAQGSSHHHDGSLDEQHIKVCV